MSADLLPGAQFSTGRKAIEFGVMCLGCFIAFFDIQIVSASIQQIGGGLSASQDELSWVQTSYLVAEIIVIPLSGWLGRTMSTRWWLLPRPPASRSRAYFAAQRGTYVR
jgi:DHA2 family multidrug resistance protein